MRILGVLAAYVMLMSVPAVSQITLTTTDVPNFFGAGKSSMTWSIEDSTVMMDVGMASSSPQVWTIPVVAWTDSMRADNVLPSSTPYQSDFPSASYAQVTMDSFDDVQVTSYRFYSVSNDSLLSIGGVLHYSGSMGGNPVDTSIYQDDMMLLAKFPITIGNSISESDSQSIGPDTYALTSRTETYDAHGTLTLPNGSFQALRSQSVETYRVYVSGSLVNTQTEYGYSWITKEGHRVEAEADTGQPSSGQVQLADVSLILSVNTPPTGVVTSSKTPETFELGQNYPNPFNPATTIRFALPSAGRVRLSVFNVLGQEVTRLVDGWMEAGAREVVWRAGEPSGLYFYRITAESRNGVRLEQTKRMVLIR